MWQTIPEWTDLIPDPVCGQCISVADPAADRPIHFKFVVTEESAKVTKDAVKLQPGKWQTTIKILSVDAPGMPAQMGAAMKQQMSAAGSQTVESCLTPEMVAKPPENMFAGGAQNCTYEKFAMSDGKMDAVLVCKGVAGGQGEMRATMSGNFGSTSYDVTSDASMNMPAMPGAAGGGKVNTKTQVIGKRVGECEAKKAS